jgi:hypothetical protein
MKNRNCVQVYTFISRVLTPKKEKRYVDKVSSTVLEKGNLVLSSYKTAKAQLTTVP